MASKKVPVIDDEYDLFSARVLRDEGIARVTTASPDQWRASYQHRAAEFLTTLSQFEMFTGEDLRRYAEARIGPAHHSNAWGGVFAGVIRKWKKDALVEDAGWSQAIAKKSHGVRIPQYVKVVQQ